MDEHRPVRASPSRSVSSASDGRMSQGPALPRLVTAEQPRRKTAPPEDSPQRDVHRRRDGQRSQQQTAARQRSRTPEASRRRQQDRPVASPSRSSSMSVSDGRVSPPLTPPDLRHRAPAGGSREDRKVGRRRTAASEQGPLHSRERRQDRPSTPEARYRRRQSPSSASGARVSPSGPHLGAADEPPQPAPSRCKGVDRLRQSDPPSVAPDGCGEAPSEPRRQSRVPRVASSASAMDAASSAVPLQRAGTGTATTQRRSASSLLGPGISSAASGRAAEGEVSGALAEVTSVVSLVSSTSSARPRAPAQTLSVASALGGHGVRGDVTEKEETGVPQGFTPSRAEDEQAALPEPLKSQPDHGSARPASAQRPAVLPSFLRTRTSSGKLPAADGAPEPALPVAKAVPSAGDSVAGEMAVHLEDTLRAHDFELSPFSVGHQHPEAAPQEMSPCLPVRASPADGSEESPVASPDELSPRGSPARGRADAATDRRRALDVLHNTVLSAEEVAALMARQKSLLQQVSHPAPSEAGASTSASTSVSHWLERSRGDPRRDMAGHALPSPLSDESVQRLIAEVTYERRDPPYPPSPMGRYRPLSASPALPPDGRAILQRYVTPPRPKRGGAPQLHPPVPYRPLRSVSGGSDATDPTPPAPAVSPARSALLRHISPARVDPAPRARVGPAEGGRPGGAPSAPSRRELAGAGGAPRLW
eukprot:TRINITY_DN6989_c0_g1_i1.p1 TRINITY_DN6989_c0_g1~~TRINITY_DN6989_c0_g1_i1.p1  ORF type:complete len:731 (+),score=59.75 TRINITY_DN6989_c0_g1_i1:81-2195(+)